MRYLFTNDIDRDKVNEDLKQIQINTYYYKKYKSENNILYFVMIMCFIIISIALVKKKMTYFDDLSYSIIVGTIMGLSLLYICYSIYALMYKDNLNYDEDDHKFNTSLEYDISRNIVYTCLKH